MHITYIKLLKMKFNNETLREAVNLYLSSPDCVYGDITNWDTSVCMSNKANVVFSDCCYLNTCFECVKRI